ncbi:hypothetical protein BGX20_005045, partial [Mortierella sp. AD010]
NQKLSTTATIRHPRVFPNSSLTDRQPVGVESVAMTDFPQTEDVFASFPAVQPQSALLTNHEYDQQDESGSHAASTGTQGDYTNSE